MQNKRKKQKGIAAAVTLLIAAVLALVSYKIIEIGIISVKVNAEKQVLDTCGILAGQKITKTNNIEEACNSQSLNQCVEDIGNSNATMECIDLGLECNDLNECKRKILVSSTYNPSTIDVTKSIEVHVNEENHEVNIIDAAVIMLLDFSGSMNGNRIRQLKSAVREFVAASYNLSYSVILYNNDIISISNIDKGLNHDQTVLSIVNNTNSGGGTNFVLPLREAMRQIRSTDHEVYYILLISDGAPNEGSNPSRDFVLNNIMSLDDNFCLMSTSQNPCITIFTLGTSFLIIFKISLTVKFFVKTL